MKKNIAFLFFICLYQIGHAQVWNQLVGDGQRTSRSAAFSINQYAYIFLGSYVQTVLSYDTGTHVWAPITDYPEGNTDGTVGCSLNGLGYAGMGVQYSTFSNDFYSYDPSGAGTWTQLANFPGTTRAYGVAFALDGKVYMGGGLSSGSTPNNDFYAYDPGSGIWSAIASCPALGVPCDAVSFVIGDTAYVGTGGKIVGGQSVPQNDFWKYDTTSKVWTQIDSIPGVRAEASAFATCDKGFVGLGYTNVPRTTDAQDFWQYSPSTGKWTAVANYGAGAINAASAVAIGNTGYVAGGFYISSTQANDLWSFTPVATPAFSAATSVCAGGSILFTDTSNYSPTNWYWQFPGGIPHTSTAQDPTVQYDTAGTWNVILTAWNGCDSGTQIFTKYITVAPFASNLTITPDSPSVCNGQSITLVANGGASATYRWAGTSDTTDSIVVNPTKDTTYELIVGSGNCSKDTMIAVKFNNAPPLIVTPPSPAVECNGQGIVLSVPASGSDYTWSPATGLSPTTGSSVTANPTADITYTVTGIDSLGCMVSAMEAISIQYGPNKPIITVSVTGDTLFSSAKNGNQWYLNGTAVNGATDSLFVITGLPKGDSISVSVTDIANGCSTSSSMYVTGINQLSVISNQLSIYPNPTNGMINITISPSAIGVKDWSLRVTDVLGRTLYTRSSLNYYNEINLSNLPSGIYFIAVSNKTARAVFPVVKQN